VYAFRNASLTGESTMSRSIPETPAEHDEARVIERPDGFYWQDRNTGEEFGPFDSLAEAVEDMKYNVDAVDGADEGEDILSEVEEELGISDWIDPETGEPAEGFGPHLEDH